MEGAGAFSQARMEARAGSVAGCPAGLLAGQAGQARPECGSDTMETHAVLKVLRWGRRLQRGGERERERTSERGFWGGLPRA